MNSFANLFSVLIVGFWMLAIAFIAVQNAQPISLEFFGLRSVPIPFGLLLTFTTVIGMISCTVLQPLFTRSRRNRFEDEY